MENQKFFHTQPSFHPFSPPKSWQKWVIPVARVKKINQAGQKGAESNRLNLAWICLNPLSQTATDKWDLKLINLVYIILLEEKNDFITSN